MNDQDSGFILVLFNLHLISPGKSTMNTFCGYRRFNFQSDNNEKNQMDVETVCFLCLERWMDGKRREG